MSWRERIEINPEIAAGRPIVKGTRLTVELLIDLLAQGWSEQEVLENYPTITREDLLACLRHAGALLQEARLHPLKA